MIARSLPGGAVCLRCRLRLLRQSTHPLLHRHAPNRFLYNQLPGLRSIANESAARLFEPEPEPENQEPEEPGRDRVLRDVEEREKKRFSRPGWDTKSFRTKTLDLRKQKHLSRNRFLTENTERLGTEALGKPAHVIVMKDEGGRRKRKARPNAQSKDSEEADDDVDVRSNIEAVLDGQGGAPTTDEVYDSIDNLRPKADTTLSKRAFGRVHKRLAEGFSNGQLHSYLHYYKEKNRSDTDTDPDPVLKKPAESDLVAVSDAWIDNMTLWVPVGNQPKDAPLSLRGYVSSSASANEKAAVRIMRECWNISIRELNNGLGEVRVKIKEKAFVLLMRGNQRFLANMVNSWLESGEKLEAFRSTQTLRFVMNKTKATMMIQLLNETLNDITIKTFPIKFVTLEPIEGYILKALERMTNTHIEISKNLQRLHIAWIQLKNRATPEFVGLEDLRHVVFRLLLTALGPRRVTMTLHAEAMEDGKEGRFITDTTSKEKLSWKDRLGQWARYILPSTTEKSETPIANPLKSLERPVEPSEPVAAGQLTDNVFFHDPRFPAHPVKWAEKRRTSTRVSFGQLLHSQRPTAPPSLPKLLTADHPRVFVPVTPHPVRLARLARHGVNSPASHKLVESPAMSTIVMRFWPAPEMGVMDRSDGGVGDDEHKIPLGKNERKRTERRRRERQAADPALELRIATNDREILGVESLCAITGTSIADVMLPSAPVDMRFTQSEYVPLEGTSRDILAAWQPLADFLGHARLDLEAGKLEVPPRQRFQLPRRLFPATDNQRREEGPPAEHQDPNDLLSATYTFVGLEMHRSVSVPFEGHTLTYTSIEAGQGGGRRAEVTLEPAIAAALGGRGKASRSRVEEVDADKLQEDFLACAHRFATADDDLWSGFPANDQRS
ncbi:mitochondrial inner-membrane-bound regulator-domain-containing protein [Whalleya microplaca]|nr:mitochondrial inner-membrane-bound regulator-domain-containing protein [Whalleya microplaca]